jgi:hypothetical protein
MSEEESGVKTQEVQSNNKEDEEEKDKEKTKEINPYTDRDMCNFC